MLKSETVDVNRLLVHTGFDQEVLYFLALVSLELDNLTKLCVVDDISVTSEFLITKRETDRDECEKIVRERE